MIRNVSFRPNSAPGDTSGIEKQMIQNVSFRPNSECKIKKLSTSVHLIFKNVPLNLNFNFSENT